MTKTQWVAELEFLAKTSKDLTFDLLWAFERIASRANFVYSNPSFAGNPFGPEILAEIREAQLRKEIRERTRYLRRKKCIQIQKTGKQTVCKMTKEGQVRALYQRIRHQDICLGEGEYTIVAFDIPEDTKATRWWWRKRLREFGFELHQRSVWISQKDVALDLSEYIRRVGAQKWVSVFRGKLIE